jgi:DNA invertase Pin-like site-specific DNA recombinase
MTYTTPPTTLPPGSTVWAYLRDSGGASQEKSVPQQESQIKEFCKDNDLHLARIFADIGKSGGSVESRDQFLLMIDLTKEEENRPAGIIVWNLARFSRDVDDADFYKSTVRRRGIMIHSLTDAIPEGQFGGVIEKLIDTANAEYRRQNSLAVKRSIQELIKQGYMTGTPARGYLALTEIIGKKRDNTPRTVSRWIPDPEVFDLVKLAWKMRAEGKSYNDIMRATEGKLYKSVTCLPTFFGNKSYLGIGKWGELEVENHHEAAIDLATWETVQEIQKLDPRTGLRNPRRIAYPSLLSGLAYCSFCGAALVYHNTCYRRNHNRTPWEYYFCGKRERSKGLKLCEAKRMSAKKINAIILDNVLNRILTPSYFDALLAETKKQYVDTETIDAKIKQKRNDLSYAERAISNLLELIESFGVNESATKRLREKELERMNTKQEIRDIESQRETLTLDITPEALALVLTYWRDQIIQATQSNDIASARVLVSYFVERIEIDHANVTIKYKYPIQTLMHTSSVSTHVGAPQYRHSISLEYTVVKKVQNRKPR